jgi:hypothetical protein
MSQKKTIRNERSEGGPDMQTLAAAEPLAISAEQVVSAPGSAPFHVTFNPAGLTSPRNLPRTAERYWLLRFGEDELRFTHRAAAELWASKLADRGTSSQLTWHDENTPEGADPERRVA